MPWVFGKAGAHSPRQHIEDAGFLSSVTGVPRAGSGYPGCAGTLAHPQNPLP